MSLEPHPPKEKPPFLYHGSPKGDIEEFIPRVSSGTGDNFGARVYASPHVETACMFMADPGVPWSTGVINGVRYAIIPLAKEEFLTKDHGGFIYKLPGDTFSNHIQTGMSQETEWSSEVAVKPVEVLHFDSVLDEMIKNKVQVYFVNPEIYRANREKGSPSWQSAIGIKSENEERGEKAINTFNPSI